MNRIVKLPALEEIEVPRHVSRVDSGRDGPSGWHGWQVRWPGHRQWFPDTRHGGPVKALEAAEAYTHARYPGKRSQVQPGAGVRLMRRPKRGRDEIYVEVSAPNRFVSPKRLYVGTEQTVTAERICAALAKADRVRQRLVREHLARSNGRSLFLSLDAGLSTYR